MYNINISYLRHLNICYCILAINITSLTGLKIIKHLITLKKTNKSDVYLNVGNN